MPLCFLHGLESSPQGTKARLLRKHYPECWIPELPPDIFKRAEIVEKGTKTAMLIVGSSLGGLTAIMVAMRRPAMVSGMVLMAPAVGSFEGGILADAAGLTESLYIPAGVPAVIVAGIRDELIPVSAVRSLVERSPDPKSIRLHEVDDDHMLHRSLSLMLKSIEQMQGRFPA
ncbi:MAG: alpha/beta hydrolase [Desulfobacteraceae bacterium]|nr:MAG: alpha/beta hydrolase [Desulfobacteraceae bacterium]